MIFGFRVSWGNVWRFAVLLVRFLPFGLRLGSISYRGLIIFLWRFIVTLIIRKNCFLAGGGRGLTPDQTPSF